MKKNKLKIRLSLITLLLTLGVYAQGPPSGRQGGQGQQGRGQQRGRRPDASEIMSKLDTNNDDKIDMEEASSDRRGKIVEDFEAIDSNEDSFIDLEELKASLENRSSKRKPRKIAPKKLIKQVDDNGDGTLNELEVAAKKKHELSEHFSTIDTNNDNELDLDELQEFYKKNEANSNRGKNRKRD